MTVALTNTIALLASIAAGLVLTAGAVRLAPRFNLVVHPRLFGKSQNSITFLGGPVLAASAICVYLVLGEPGPVIAVLLIASLAAMVLGFLDDLLSARDGLTPRTRLAVEVVIAGAAWSAGISAVTTAPAWLDFAITVIFLVGGMNAFNLIDNMDGVAGVTAMAVAFGVAAFALAGGHPQYALLAICLGGASLAFLFFNFKSPRAYLGDAGSLFLGLSLSGMALTIDAGFRPPGNFVVALVIFAVPFTDTVTRQLSRWVSGGSVLDITGSTDHLSHRLVARGFSPAEVASLHGIAGLFATAAAGISALFLLAAPMLLTLGAFAAFGLAFVWDAWRGANRPVADAPAAATADNPAAEMALPREPLPAAGKPV